MKRITPLTAFCLLITATILHAQPRNNACVEESITWCDSSPSVGLMLSTRSASSTWPLFQLGQTVYASGDILNFSGYVVTSTTYSDCSINDDWTEVFSSVTTSSWTATLPDNSTATGSGLSASFSTARLR